MPNLAMTDPRAPIRRLLRAQIEDIWGAGRTELVARNYAPDVVDHMPVPGQPSGRDALAEVVTAFRAGLPDLRMELHATLVAGDIGVDVWTLTGTHTGPLLGHEATGKPVAIAGIDMVRVAGGRIRELWHVEEMGLLMQQIGAESFAFGTPMGTPDVGTQRLATTYCDPSAAAYVPGAKDLNVVERRNLASARRHIGELWGEGRTELAEVLFHPCSLDHNPAPGQRAGIPGILDVLQWLREAVPDLVLRVDALVVEGDLVCDRWTMTGTHTGAPLMGIEPRGRPFAINGMDVVRIDEAGLITDVWHAEEFAQLRAQIA